MRRRLGFRILSAAKATIGVDLTLSRQPHLILRVSNLPVIHGNEVLKILYSLRANAMLHAVELGLNPTQEVDGYNRGRP